MNRTQNFDQRGARGTRQQNPKLRGARGEGEIQPRALTKERPGEQGNRTSSLALIRGGQGNKGSGTEALISKGTDTKAEPGNTTQSFDQQGSRAQSLDQRGQGDKGEGPGDKGAAFIRGTRTRIFTQREARGTREHN